MMTLQLEQVPKRDKDEKIYLVIVGADGRKFNEEQGIKTRTFIWNLLAFGIPKQEKLTDKDLKTVPTDWDRKKRVVVSGGCPIGKKRYWCFELERFVDNPNDYAGKGYQFLEVYDKGGIDTWAEIIATKLGILTEIYRPEVHQWSDKQPKQATIPVSVPLKGYRSRNIDMAKIGTIGYDIEVAGNCRHCGGSGKLKQTKVGATRKNLSYGEAFEEIDCYKCKGTGAYSGGTFTINQMKKLGKEVHQIILE